MQIFLDEKRVEPEQATCVGEAIAAAAAVAEQDGRLIVEVHVDGDAWSNEQLEAPEQLNAEADEVRLVTAEPRALVSETLADACDVLADIESLQNAAADRIQADQPAEAMPKLNEAFTLWTAVHQAVLQGASVTGIELDKVMVDDRPAAEIVQQLVERLRDLRDHLQRKDPLALADVLMYELPEVVNAWKALLTALRAQVRDV